MVFILILNPGFIDPTFRPLTFEVKQLMIGRSCILESGYVLEDWQVLYIREWACVGGLAGLVYKRVGMCWRIGRSCILESGHVLEDWQVLYIREVLLCEINK